MISIQNFQHTNPVSECKQQQQKTIKDLDMQKQTLQLDEKCEYGNYILTSINVITVAVTTQQKIVVK